MTTPAKKPADRQPKASSGYKFKAKVKNADGKLVERTFTLPKITEDTANKVNGGLTRQAILNPDDDRMQLQLALAMLEAADPGPGVMDALDSLGGLDMIETVMRWMGESSGSSS